MEYHSRQIPVGKIKLPNLLGDAGFQGTFHRVSQQIVCAGIVTIVEQEPRLFCPQVGQPLKVVAVQTRACHFRLRPPLR